MKRRTGAAEAAAAIGVILVSALLAAACTGGQEGKAAEEQQPKKNPISSPVSAADSRPLALAPAADRTPELKAINNAIPVYAGAKYRDDLTRRDEVMVRNQYGPNADVITLATDDSYPQVYHYYTTYLAQFRAYPAQPPYPLQQNWRSLEVQLNQAMRDPFIPGDALKPNARQVTLQIAETEAEPKTVIRYILTPEPIQASALPPAAPQQ
jgi:hypothetical protein